MTPSAQSALYALLRRDFPSFLHKAFVELCPGAEFKSNWHLEAIAYRLEQVQDGTSQRLIITIPPRSLKSISISVAWVAWMLGRDPSLKFVCVSYSSELALKHARDCRAVMQSPWYRKLFPKTVLERAPEHDLVTARGGGRYSTSIGGTLTGRGGDIIIIDDPMKAEEAMSEAVRKSVLDWVTGTLFSRLDDKTKGSIILVMQRLHEEDLAGQLLEGGGWEHLNLPAIAEQDEIIPILNGAVHVRRSGEVLHPAREPLSVLEQQKAAMGSLAFSAQYQQAPVPAEGALIKGAWIRRYDALPAAKGAMKVQSWDCAAKVGEHNDYSVCITALVKGQDIYILHVGRGRMSFPELVETYRIMATEHRPDAILVEDASAGQQLIQQFQSTPLKGIIGPIAIRPDRDKLVRASAASVSIEGGQLYLPDDAPWLAEFERELLAFPNGRHDDQVDALAQLILWARDRAPKLPPLDVWTGESPSHFGSG